MCASPNSPSGRFPPHRFPYRPHPLRRFPLRRSALGGFPLRRFPLGLLVLALAAASAAAAPPAARTGEAFAAVSLAAPLAPDALAAKLADRRVVYIGETHPRYADHLHQLALIEALHARDPGVVIGVEYFERRFQSVLDDYVAGRVDERTLLQRTEYFRSWGYDYRLYAPIFRFARRERIHVVALNVPRALPAAVAKVGLEALSKAQRAELPQDMGPAGAAYRKRLREAYAAHGSAEPGDFEHFVEAQLVWDEGMAASAAAYLDSHPGRRMVVLAGSGHVEFGDGIPARLARRTGVSYAIALNGGVDEPGMADYTLLGDEAELPPAGVLGVELSDADPGCRVRALSPGGAAARSGIRRGDLVVAIDGEPVASVADARLALWDKRPGAKVSVRLRHKRVFGVRERTIEVVLGPAGS